MADVTLTAVVREKLIADAKRQLRVREMLGQISAVEYLLALILAQSGQLAKDYESTTEEIT